jgi:hypothetical protein
MKQYHSTSNVVLATLFSVFLCVFAAKAEVNSELSPSPFSQAELAQVLAPIALYPDTLLTHILIAATYPLEVIAAERWQIEHSHLSTEKMMKIAEVKDWDASVKALLGFPRVLKNLSSDIVWMQKVGDAFLQDEAEVLISIQVLRQQADKAGSLAQMDNVDIVRQQKTIIIKSARPEIIYVPYYDSRIVYGNWQWFNNQPVYWHRPLHLSYHRGPFYWHSGVHIAFDFFFNAFHWSNHHVVVHHHNRRYQHSNHRRYHSPQRISTSYQAKRWQHNPYHRKGVSYRSDKITKKYRSIRPSYASSKISRAKQKLPYNSNKMTNKNYRSTKHHELNKRIKTKYTIKDRQTHQQHKNAITAMNKVKVSSQIGFTTEPYADKNWQRQKPIIGINNSNNNNKNYQNMTKSYQQPKAVKNIKTKSNKSINKATKSTKTNYSYSKQKSMATKPVKKQHVANQRRTKVKHSASEKIRRH